MHAKLLEFRDLAPDVRHFAFEVPGLERLEFTPGQFISLSDEVDGRTVTRSYSLASPPDGNRFDLCLSRTNLGTYSPHLFGLKPGEEIPMKGPLGSFALRHPISDSVFVATGTGVAPFRSMLNSGSLWTEGRKHTLVLGVRHQDGVLYGDEFEALERRYSAFRFWPVVSKAADSWRGRRGHVQDHLLEAVGKGRDTDVYICGLEEMVNHVRQRLKALGFAPERLIYEKSA